MSKQSNIEKLVISDKKVFSTEDLAVIWGITERRGLSGANSQFKTQVGLAKN
jgi:hypothetical protein